MLEVLAWTRDLVSHFDPALSVFTYKEGRQNMDTNVPTLIPEVICVITGSLAV